MLGFKPCWNSTFSAATGYVLQIRCLRGNSPPLVRRGPPPPWKAWLPPRKHRGFGRPNQWQNSTWGTKTSSQVSRDAWGPIWSVFRICALVWFPKNSTATWPSDLKLMVFIGKSCKSIWIFALPGFVNQVLFSFFNQRKTWKTHHFKILCLRVSPGMTCHSQRGQTKRGVAKLTRQLTHHLSFFDIKLLHVPTEYIYIYTTYIYIYTTYIYRYIYNTPIYIYYIYMAPNLFCFFFPFWIVYFWSAVLSVLLAICSILELEENCNILEFEVRTYHFPWYLQHFGVHFFHLGILRRWFI